MKSLAISLALIPLTLAPFSSVAQPFERLPSVPGIDISQVEYVRAETVPDRQIEQVLAKMGYEAPIGANYPSVYLYNKIDINGDRQPEAIVIVRSFAVCGTGGCPFFILQGNGSAYARAIYETLSSSQYIIITPQKTNSWNNLITPVWDRNSQETRYLILKFNGREYTVSGEVQKNTTLTGRVVVFSDNEHPLPSNGK
ncbi:hypothetical protein IQ249_21975 [Lusitaniella coriacea LEGE 07157]|uniref:Uncharacterized protein n=1 Tax=Lusitaniella coriacea LEGE 07157 TaxID=945747 RepID=A0A8J7E141_9CYAN|nr:hypothetical protein [Lusitaniella coriacea]MBE9118561.1 hypothetical protein [Lusitaniella coriacea LEGE 07157]